MSLIIEVEDAAAGKTKASTADLKKSSLPQQVSRIIFNEEDGKEYTEIEWYKLHGWLDKKDRVNLKEFAEEVYRLYNNGKRQSLRVRRNVVVNKLEDNKAGNRLSRDEQLHRARRLHNTLRKEFEGILKADDHARKGGDSLNPNLCTVSFPGDIRGDLFSIFRDQMKLRLGFSGDVHAMNDSRKDQQGEKASLRPEWIEELGNTTSWPTLIAHLKNIKTKRSKKRKYKDGKSAPEWFVHHWGVAAWNCAVKHSEKGTGVIILKSLDKNKYSKSPWCELERLFCECLQERFPGSVYTVDDAMHQLVYQKSLVNTGGEYEELSHEEIVGML